jgi:DNA repair exonuclease SbcCD ATPase subunit
MEIKLKSMVIENFKKVKRCEINFAGESMRISGENRTGKTTVFDAFTWCLFGKDSLGKTDFEIKPKLKNGQVVHNVETSVELVLLIDGHEKTLKRTYREVYKKTRGEVDLTFSGHTSDYFVDGVSKLQIAYKQIVDAIIPENLFRMLTSTSYFTSLGWKEQRDIIFKLVSDVKDLEIIEASEELLALKNELVLGKTVDDVLSVAKADKKKINEQLKNIPFEIKGIANTEYKNLSDDYDDAKNDVDLKLAYDKLSKAESERAQGSIAEEIARDEDTIRGIRKEIQKYEDEKEKKVRDANKENDEKAREVLHKKDNAERELKKLRADDELLKTRIDNGLKTIVDEKTSKEKLLARYHELKDKSFAPENCAYCGQVLPKEKLDELEKKFNLEKATTLEKIIEDGKSKAATIEKYEKAVDKLLAERKENDSEVAVLEGEITKLANEYNDALKTIVVDTSEFDKEIEKREKRIDLLEKGIKKLKETKASNVVDNVINELKATIAYLSDRKAEYKLKLQNDERVKILEAEEKDLRKKFEKAVQLQTLCEKFVVAKSDYLQNKINARFELVKFELFEKLVNGGIEPTCVATVDGVNFPSVNNGGRINAGLDIIKTLQRIYDVKAPIFIDNAESVSDWLIDLDCQLIKMYVVEGQNELLFEKEEI